MADIVPAMKLHSDQTTITVRKRTLKILRQICRESGCTRIHAAELLGRAWESLSVEQREALILRDSRKTAEVAN